MILTEAAKKFLFLVYGPAESAELASTEKIFSINHFLKIYFKTVCSQVFFLLNFSFVFRQVYIIHSVLICMRHIYYVLADSADSAGPDTKKRTFFCGFPKDYVRKNLHS